MAACTGSTSDPEDRQTAAEPRTPSWNIKTLTRTFSQDTSTSTATWFSGTGTLLKSKHEEDPPAHYETRFCTLGFALKIVEWTLCILCTGLFFEGSALIYDFKKQLVPYIAYWTYMMITGVIILSYLLGQKMREMLIRIYNIIGALMFFIAAIIIFSITVENWETWNRVDPTTPPPPTTTASPKKKRSSPSRQKLAGMLLTQSILCFINSFVYFFDTAYSLYSSYKTVQLDLQVKFT
ncbi:hypothetical protein R5R35_002353 [Gryllus longicercus]|uniref:Uncharacterized protein n=1 Tax=Gryllus longicercus TaxID=2509291 RepID=A0AAN9Z7B9_9ORTH